MIENGVIKEIDKKGYATVVFNRKTACENCRMCLKSKDEMTVSVRVKTDGNAQSGDRVDVEMSNAVVLKAAFIVYFIPVVLCTVALFATRSLLEPLQFATLLAALAVSLGISVAVDRYFKRHKLNVPIIVQVYPAAIENATIPQTVGQQVDNKNATNTSETLQDGQAESEEYSQEVESEMETTDAEEDKNTDSKDMQD